MKSLFDTMAYARWHLHHQRMPEKWESAWNETAYRGTLYLTEPLISEIYLQVAKKNGHVSAMNCILKIKSLPGVEFFPSVADEKIGDQLAIEAACIQLQSQQEQKKGERKNQISLVDASLIAISKCTKATIYTADHEIRDSARRINCAVNFLPIDDLL